MEHTDVETDHDHISQIKRDDSDENSQHEFHKEEHLTPEQLKFNQTGALTRVTKKRNAISDLIIDENNLHLVKTELSVLNDYVTYYQNAHTKLIDSLEDEETIDRETTRYEARQKSVIDFRCQVSDWIRKSEHHLSDECNSATGSHRTSKFGSRHSHKSGKSSRSSISAHAKEQARLAELMIEKDLLQKKQALKIQADELKHQADELKLEEEIAKSRARERIFALDDGIHEQPPYPIEPLVTIKNLAPQGSQPVLLKKDIEQSTQKPPLIPNPTTQSLHIDRNNRGMCALNPQAPVFEAHDVPTYSNQGLINDQESHLITTNTLLAALSLPHPELPKFSGDLTEYATFKNAFESRVACRVTSSADKLYYLHQHLVGEPKELIKGCLYVKPEFGYAEAQRLLDKEYGDPYKLSMLYLKKVHEWPVVKQDDNVGLKRLSLFLTNCNWALQSISYLNVLNNPSNMQCIWKKLPFYLQNKWREHVNKARRQQQKELLYPDLVVFVADAADIVNDPVYDRSITNYNISYQANNDRIKSSAGSAFKDKQKMTSFVSNATSVHSSQVQSSECPHCQQCHELDHCETFTSKSIEEKRSFIKDKRLCFGCYGFDHFTKGCINRLKCRICNKQHPTALHVDGFQLAKSETCRYPSQSENNNAAAMITEVNKEIFVNMDQNVPTSTCSAATIPHSVIMYAILPVRVYQKGSDQYVITYCFYDNGSQGCFMTEALREQLKALGIETDLQLRTMHGSSVISSMAVNGLVITDMNGENPIDLPRTYTRDEIPVSSQYIPTPEMINGYDHLRCITDILPEYIPDIAVGILVGSNCPQALEPLEVIPTNGSGPFATRLRHGWTVYGPLQVSPSNICHMTSMTCNRILIQETQSVKELISPACILRMFEMDFNDNKTAAIPGQCDISQEDSKFLEIVEKNIIFQDGQYIVPLPFREKDPLLPNNKIQALKRAQYQQKKMIRDEQYNEDYKDFIQKMLDNGYAEPVTEFNLKTLPGKVWYLPHHGVYNSNKPGKIRIVFDCSATFLGTSLNDHLIQGPNLANSLLGVLTRFRDEQIAFSGDVESMFYRVRIPVEQRSFLRFLWWPNGDFQQDIAEYQMNVHIFGAASSPSIANFVLKRIGSQASNPAVTHTIHRNFYVDDCLKSTSTSDEAVKMITDLRNTCMDGGFRLTKFLSNNHSVIVSVPKDERAKEMQVRDLYKDPLPVVRTLGVQWSVENDVFGFSITLKDKPFTRRGILATVSSIYDPLGFVAPVILPAKKLLQDLCKDEQLDWDTVVPDEYATRWSHWLHTIPGLKRVSIPRCSKPDGFNHITSRQLHVFADASSSGYGTVAYLRLSNQDNEHCVSFVAGKARLAPLKTTTIPRLELTAAVTAVKLACMIKCEMDYPLEVRFYTDSSTVLRYIANDRQRYPIFVANRVQIIRDFSQKNQWFHVISKLNPADEASRGLTVDELSNDTKWLTGPKFLCDDEQTWPDGVSKRFLDDGDTTDLHILDAATTLVVDLPNPVERLINYFSGWYRLRRAVAVFLKVKSILHDRVHNKGEPSSGHMNSYKLTVDDINGAELVILEWIHLCIFPDDIKQLSETVKIQQDAEGQQARVSCVRNSSPLYQLSPFLKDGVLCVGGRLSKSSLPECTKHPYILPRKHHVTTLIIRETHENLGHAGRNHVLSELRNRYWIINGNSAVRQVLYMCVHCRRTQRPTQQQKMSDLPSCRVDNISPPFWNTGVDYFGPFMVKCGRKEVKRYGVLFTCLSSRAVHLEVADSLETDSFINVLRRFIARRGNVKSLYSDNGTNFIGAEKELHKALTEMHQDSIQNTLRSKCIEWTFNPPTASHMGGSWERMIRTVRKVLTGLLQEHGTRLDVDSFHTLLCEVESIVNSRPITDVSSDHHDLEALTPNHILTGKACVTTPPPGIFQREDVYMRRRWRRVQYLANLFWSRWRNEYLLLQQKRQKWIQPQRNMKTGDIVLIRDDTTSRNSWPLGLVQSTESDSSGYVRAVTVKTQNSLLRRPINKLVLLVTNDD